MVLTSGASPTIHLQSGLNASGPLHNLSNTALPNTGTLYSNCSNKTWKWSQSSGRSRSFELAETCSSSKKQYFHRLSFEMFVIINVINAFCVHTQLLRHSINISDMNHIYAYTSCKRYHYRTLVTHYAFQGD